MVKDKKYTIYDFSLYAILFVILSAILVALLRLFNVGVSVFYVIKISLPKIITGIKLMIAPTLALFGAMVTDPAGCRKYYRRLNRHNETLDGIKVKDDLPQSMQYKDTELFQYITHKNIIFSIISYSLTFLSTVIILSAIINGKVVNIGVDSGIKELMVNTILASIVLFIIKRTASIIFYGNIGKFLDGYGSLEEHRW